MDTKCNIIFGGGIVKYFYFVGMVFLVCAIGETERQFGRISDSIDAHRQEVSRLKMKAEQINYNLECIYGEAHKIDNVLTLLDDDVWSLKATLHGDIEKLNNTISGLKFGGG